MKKSFYKICSIALVIAMVLSVCVCSVATVSAKGIDYTEYFTNRGDGLKNTYAKLKNGEQLNVVYFGGSVTVGSGSTNGGNWRELTGKWLEGLTGKGNQFPYASINNINAAYGDTGTWFGMYRMYEEILAYDPDLVFIECAINDVYNQLTYDQSSQYFETIVRKIRKEKPDCDIVTLLYTEKGKINALVNNDKMHGQAQAHEDVSVAYKIPSIRIGHALADAINKEAKAQKKGWEELWSSYVTDIVHPNNKGYAIVFDAIKAYLQSELCGTKYEGATVVKHSRPCLVNTELMDGNVKFIDADEELNNASVAFGGTNFTYDGAKGYSGKLAGALSTKDKKAVFKVKFTGTELVMLGGMLAESNDSLNYPTGIIVKIDGGKQNVQPLAVKPPHILATGLKSGTHTAEISIQYPGTAAYGGFSFSGFFSRDASKATKESTIPKEFKKVKKDGTTKYQLYYDGFKCTKTGLYKVNDKYFYVKSGIWQKVTKILKYNGKYFYIKSGKWEKVTKLVKYSGKYFLVKSGKWDSSVKTLFKYNGKYFAIKSGKWYKGKMIIPYKGKKFYVNKGFAQLKFSGKIKYNYRTYKIKKGKVV